MNTQDILKHVDHTLLRPDATEDEIKQVCDDGLKYATASVCIPPSYVAQAYEYLHGRVKICTVIGFPNGYNTTKVKRFEAQDAIDNGADEIDMVINIGWVKDGKFDKVRQEIESVRSICKGKVLKVIIETCLLTDEEKIKLCKIVGECGADYIKTSTGFSTGGATFEDVVLLRKNVPANVSVKASGGISGLADGEKYIQLGAGRLGTSRIISEVKKNEIQ